MAYRDRSLPEEEIQAYLAQAQPNQIRSASNPQADQAAENARRAQAEADRAAKEAAALAQQQAKQAAKQASETQARNVRSWKAIGAQTETDVQTGRQDLVLHPDGTPKSIPGPIGAPQVVAQETTNPSASAAASILGGGGDGAIGASGTTTRAISKQLVRGDRFNQSWVDPDSKTDKDTGIQYVEQTDPNTGMKVKQAVGVDIAAKEAARQAADLKRRAQEIDLRENQIKVEKMRFQPQWEPIKKEFDHLSKELENFPQTFRRNPTTGKMEKIDPKTDSAIPHDPRELAVWQRKKAELETKHAEAKAKHDRMFPFADNLDKAEKAALEEKTKLEEDRILAASGLQRPSHINELFQSSPDGKVTFEDHAAAVWKDLGVTNPTPEQIKQVADQERQAQQAKQDEEDKRNGVNPFTRQLANLDIQAARAKRDASTGAIQPEEADKRMALIAETKNQTIEQAKAEAKARLDERGREIAAGVIGTGNAAARLSGTRPDSAYRGMKGDLDEIGSREQKISMALESSGGDLDKAIAELETPKKQMTTLEAFGIPFTGSDKKTVDPKNAEAAKQLRAMKAEMDKAGIDPKDRPALIKDAAKMTAWTEKDSDNIRKLSSGDLVINPGRVFGQKDALVAEINASDVTPAQKKSALKRLESMREAMADRLDTLMRKGIVDGSSYAKFAREQKEQGKDPVEILDQWMTKQKDRNIVFKSLDAIATGITTGSMGIAKTLIGGGAGLSALVGADETAGSLGKTARYVSQSIDDKGEASSFRGMTGAYGIASDITDTVVQMAPMVVGGGIAGGLKGLGQVVTRGLSVYGWAAAQGYESKLSDALDLEQSKLVRSLTGEEVASVLGRADTQVAGFLNAAQTAILAAAFPKGSEAGALGKVSGGMTISDFLRKGGARALKDGTLRKEIAAIGRNIFADATDEALEEFSNQVLDGMISMGVLGQKMQLGTFLEQSFKAGALGALVGGAMPQFYKGKSKQEQHEELVTVLQSQIQSIPDSQGVTAALHVLDPQAKPPTAQEIKQARQLVQPSAESIGQIEAKRQEYDAAIKAQDFTKAAAIDQEIHDSFVQAQSAVSQDMADAVILTRELGSLEQQASESIAQAEEALTQAKMSGDKQAIAQAEVNLEQVQKSAPKVPLVRAAVKLATGMDVSSLTDSELRAVGYKPAKPDADGKVASYVPMSASELKAEGLTKPMIRFAADGSAIIIDEAIDQVTQTSGLAATRIKLGEQEAMQAAQARAAAAKEGEQSQPQQTNGQDQQGQARPQATETNSPSAPADPNASGDNRGSGSRTSPASGPAPKARATIDATGEAAFYESARQEDPSLPDIPTKVKEAFDEGNAVSVSMQKASGLDVPDGYTRKGNVWTPPVDVNETPSREKQSDLSRTDEKQAKLAEANQVAENVKKAVEKRMPALKGRIEITQESRGTGGAEMIINKGTIQLSAPDIAKAIKNAGGDIEKATANIENIVARHEAVHVVQTQALRQMWEAAGSPGTFEAFFLDYYGKMAPQLLTDEAIEAARNIYGKDAWDAISSEALKAAEYTRMLVESKLDPDKTNEFSELFRAISNNGAKSAIAKLIKTAIEMLRKMELTGEAAEHVAKIEELYKELTKETKPQEAPEKPANKGTAPETNTETKGLRIETKGNTAKVFNGNEMLWEGAADKAQAELENLKAAQSSPIYVTGNAIKSALEKFPRLSGKLRAELEDAADDITDELADVPAAERMAVAEKTIADRIDRIADREAERTGKNRMEVIEGFRAVAGKRASQQAASIEQAVIGTEKPEIPKGKKETRPTPNGEMNVDVTSTYVDLDQLVGSSDPLFPGAALQPRNRATQASQNQREEMVQNLRDKPDQHRRYLEGVTTDSGRMIVAPLFGSDGKHLTNDAGKPLFYVVSGNGRRNALKEASNRNVAGPVMKGFRETATTEGIDTADMALPVPVGIFVPTSAKEAIDLAEFSNRDAQLSVSNTEQANRDAASIEKANILKLWAPDASGDAGAASNRDFVKAFARASGDEGIIDNRGNLTDEGAQRIERAMVAMLLGPKESTLLDQLFNRSSALGMRGILNGVAAETGNLLKLAATKPDFDLSPALADALRTAVEAKQSLANGEIRDVSEFFDQGNLFDSTAMTPERQLARAIVESRSRKAIRDILGAYRQATEAVDTGTMSMFAEADTTRDDLILKALEARPIEQVIAEVEAEFGKNADLPSKLRIAASAIKKLDAGQRREFAAAIGAEVERLRDGVLSAPEWQRLNPDALSAKEALFQRFLDSHDAKTIAGGFNRLLSKPVQEALKSSPDPSENDFHVFPDHVKSYGLSRSSMPQIKMPDRAGFIDFLRERGVMATEEDVAPNLLKPSQLEYSRNKANRAKGLPEDRRILISSDNYLLDGHHQWIAQMDRKTVPVVRIGLPIEKAIQVMREFPNVQKSSGIESALEEAQSDFDALLKQYRKAKPESNDADVPNMLKELAEEHGRDLVQSVMRDVTERRNSHQEHKESFDNIIKKIAKDHKARPMLTDLKGVPRSVIKTIVEYKGDANMLMDVLRGSIVAKTLTDVETIVDSLKKAFPEVVKLKDRFTKPLDSGYMDIMMTVEIAPGVHAEVQVHIPEMIQAKSVGHAYYDEQRVLPAGDPKIAELDSIMQRLYTTALRVAMLRATIESNSDALMGSALVSKLRSVWSENFPLVPPNQFSGSFEPGSNAAGTLSISKNLVPTGNLEEFTTNSRQNGNPSQDISGSSLQSSAVAEPDLFGAIEDQILGPRAKVKRNALKAIQAQTPGSLAQTNIAKAVAKAEGLADLDLFAAAAQSNLDAKPKRGESAIDASASRQPSDPLNPRLHGGQSAKGSRGAGSDGATQDLFGWSGGPSGESGGQAGGSTASNVQGSQAGVSGGGNGSASTSADVGGGRSGAGRPESGNASGQQDAGNAGKRRVIERQRPLLGSPDRNFTIGKNTVLSEGGAVTRLRNNLSAIDLLRTLETEGRNATTEEKAALAKYVGWGGIPQVFDEEKARKVRNGDAETLRSTANKYSSYGPAYVGMVKDYRDQADAIDKWNEKWGDHYRKLKDLLSPDEWESARDSTINAHYTSPTVISAMWDAVKRLGFDGGNVLEPAGGIGHFFGLMPSSLVGRSHQFGVELDSVSGRIFSKLYPEADVEVTAFQDSTLPDNSQDLVISNVPFANITVSDAYLDSQEGAPKFNLHNYFFEKALRTARPGGLVAFITTANTMDSSITQRKWLAERSDFLGAIRLPNDAFKGNANTEVVTDIIFLRKPDGSPNPMAAEQWTSTQSVELEGGGKIDVNEYFARHPEMILGRLADDGSMYGGKKEMTVHSTGDLAEQLREAVSKLPENVIGEGQAENIERQSKENSGAKDGAFIEENGKLRIKGSTSEVPVKEHGKIRAFMKLRDTLNDLYAMEADPEATDDQIAKQRAALNRAYDGFKSIYKQLHDSKTKKLLETDPDFFRTLGLEVPVGEKKILRLQEFRKADVFTKRVLRPQVAPESAETIDDALLHSFRWKGRLDTRYIGKLLGIPVEEAESRLLATEFAYRDPATGKIEHATNYLAGNVRKKLRDAEFAAKTDAAMQRNVDALKAAMPEDVGWADINFKMGSAWIPAEMYEQFLTEKVFNGRRNASVIYNKGVGDLITDSFVVQQAVGGYGMSIDDQWGARSASGGLAKSATEIAEALLNQRDPRVTRQIDGKPVYDAEATEKARAAAERMAEAFQEWVSGSTDVQERLHRIYNESFNSHVVPKYDGSFMQLPWVASDFDLYPDKKHVVWRALQEGTLLVAHGVGGGKTIIGTAIAMEARRLGLAKKPLIVVHNATLEQFATTISQMAPTARVLVARKEDLEGSKRKEFMGRVRSGDWDAVVMAHSTFDLIPDDPKWEKQQIADLISELEDAIREQGGDPDLTDLKKIKDPSVKELVKMRTRLKDRMGKLQDRVTDDVLTFQELGIDAMIVDEVHRYKKQPFVTRQSNIAGIDNSFSKRGSAMQLRAKWVQAINQGRGVFTMTGTPVTNTLGESWNMVRLVRPDLLKEFGVKTFDRFVSVFGNIKQSGELRPNGQYKPVTRLSEFTNIPEWNRFWGLAADVKMGDDMEVKGRPKIKGGKPSLTAVERTPQVKAIIDEISKVIDRYDKMSGKEKQENRHIPLLTYAAARMAAIDVRLINPEAKDEGGSKVNTALKNVLRIYGQTTAEKGTQVIFSDSYRPLKTTKLDLSAAEFEQEVGDGSASEVDDGEGFNLYHDMREKLVKAGVPRSEIAIISEAKNDKQREAMFARVNSGEIRIIMGSTETLGTGVNMQQRMAAAHHLDVPWTPAGLEQRDGRVYRQGNMWAEIGAGEIEIMRYGMKDTLDAALWQKLETKERMIKQAVSGKVNARVIEDDAGLLNYMEQKAALSGADGMLKFELDEKVRQLKNDFRAHRNRRFDLQRATTRAQGYITEAETSLPNARRVAKVVAPLVGSNPAEVEWTFEDGEKLKGEDARKALDVMFKERRKRAGAIMNPQNAESVREPIHATANGVPVLLNVESVNEDLANSANQDLRWNILWSVQFETEGKLNVFRASSPHPGSVINQTPVLAQNLAVIPEGLDNRRAQAEKDLETYASEIAKPFAKQADFGKALVDQAVLYKRMGLGFPESAEMYQAALGDGWPTTLDNAVKASQPGETSLRSEMPGDYPGAGLAPQMKSLGSSPDSSAVQEALTKMPPIYRKVFEDIEAGDSPSVVMKRHGITEKAITNILNQVRARVATATTAASAPLKPTMQDGKIAGGRPDLALSTNPAVAAVDQIRNESKVPDVRHWDEVNAKAAEMLEKDYQGTYDALLAKSREQQPLNDAEVAASKMIIARETLSGKITSPEDRIKLGMMIYGYREQGTETARSLAIRRDPHLRPAERHAQFIAEALFTPDSDTRRRMKKNPKAAETILAGWMSRVDAIEAELLAQGIDIRSALAEFNATQEEQKQSAEESPMAATVIEEQIRKLNRREKAVIDAIRSGALVSKAAFLTGLSTDEVKAIYSRFLGDIRTAMAESAKRFLAGSLASSPADMMSEILTDLGLPDIGMIDDTQPDFVDRRGEKKRAPRKPRKPTAPQVKAPEIAYISPEQQAALDEAFERFKDAKPSTWKTFWQTEVKKLAPMVGQKGFEEFKGKAIKPWMDAWQTEMDSITDPTKRMSFDEWVSRPASKWTAEQAELFQDVKVKGEVSTTTGNFDIHDPISVKRAMDAFAVARGGKMDALMEFWKMSILTGPQTHIVNAGSNVLNSAFNLLPRRGVEATVNSLLGLAGQGSEKAATFGEFAPMMRNLKKGVQLGARMALRSWQAETRTFEAYATAEALQLDFTGVGAEYVPPALGGKIGKIMRSLSFRAMTAADEFQKSVYAQMEAAAQAHRIAAVEEKLTGDDYGKRIDELMIPGSVAWIRAVDAAKRVTFQDELDGSNPQMLRRLDQMAEWAKKGRNAPWFGTPLTFFLPFIDTPLNIFKQAIEMSPLGGFISVVDASRALKRRIFAGKLTKAEAQAEAALIYDRARAVQDLTNQTLAWAAYFALEGLVGGGDDDDLPVITGTVPYKSTRKGERDNAYAVMPPQTIRIGDVQFSYSRVEPIATVLASTVNLLVSIKRNGGFNASVGSEWLSNFKDQAKDKTFLQGISALIDALEDPDRFADRLTANIATGFVPNIIRQPIREADGVLRDQSPRAEDGFFASVAKRVGFSLVPELAPARMDVWGNEIKTNRGSLVGGSAETDIAFRIFDPTNAQVNPTADPIDRWIYRYNLRTADSKERIAIEPIGSSIIGKAPGEKRPRVYPLTVQEQQEANQNAGRAAREMLGEGWDKQPLESSTAQRIVDTVKKLQSIERDRLRNKKMIEASGE